MKEPAHEQDEGQVFVGGQAGGEGLLATGGHAERSAAIGGHDSGSVGGHAFAAGGGANAVDLLAAVLSARSPALEGLLAALAPRPLGKQPSLENRVKQLEKQLETAHRQCARQEALVRVTQRALGLSVAPPPKAATAQGGRPGRKKRQPVVRALKAARTLHAQASATSAPEVAGDSAAAAVQQVASLAGAAVRP